MKSKQWMVWMVAVALAGCGGGGGGGGGGGEPGGGGGTPPPPPPPPPAASPTGLLWHSNYPLDYQRGTLTGRLPDGRPTLVDSSETATPSADGMSFASFEYDVLDDETLITVKRVGLSTPLYQVPLSGYARNLQISPTDPKLLLVRWGSSAISNDDEWTVIDIAARTIRNRLPGGNAGASWLPDGRFLYLSSSQALGIGVVGTAGTTAAGQLAVTGRVPRALAVDPQGQRLLARLVTLDGSGAVTGTDLWIARLDGSEAYRYTSTNITTAGVWSHDGQFVGFSTDTAAACTGAGCPGTGSCEVKVAPASGRELTATAAGVNNLRLPNTSGASQVLGCPLLGWTP
jgi:hypothetical protein